MTNASISHSDCTWIRCSGGVNGPSRPSPVLRRSTEKGLHGYDKGEGLLLDRTVISLGCSKLAAQVADWMFHLIHNLEQNCTQTSLGSIYRYRKRQIIIGWSQYWTGRQS